MSPALTRRALVTAAAAAGLVARPALAVAATDGDAEILIRLIGREEGAALAYARAGAGGGFGADEEAHAKALRTHLEALGRRAPSAAESSGAARRLAQARPGDRTDAAIALEGSLIAAYRDALLGVAEPNMLQTAGTILAGHAQHRALLLRRAGRDPLGE